MDIQFRSEYVVNMIQSIDVAFPHIKCCACGTLFKVANFIASDGVCNCGRQIFDVSIRIRTKYKTERDAMDQLNLLAAAVSGEALGLGIAGALVLGGGRFETGTEDRTYDLHALNGALILQLAQEQSANVVEFIRRIRCESAKANLKQGQGLCRQCGEVFSIGLAGCVSEGFCSKVCKRNFELVRPSEIKNSAPTMSAQSLVAQCPNVTSPLKSDLANRIVVCGAAHHSKVPDDLPCIAFL